MNAVVAVVSLFVLLHGAQGFAAKDRFNRGCSPHDIARLGGVFPPRKTDHLQPVAETKVFPADPKADLPAFLARKEFIVETYNVANLFSSVGSFKPDPKTGKRLQVKDADIKSEKARKGVAKTILTTNPDIAVLQEVELRAGEEFCAQELGGQYTALEIRGNDGRGIDVVVIVKKGLPIEVTYKSHKNEPLEDDLYPDMERVFSRDVTASELRIKGTDKPFLVLLGGHGKSKRTETEEDPQSTHLREQQGDRWADIAQMYMDKYGAPVISGADYNDSPHTARAYQGFRDMGFKDAFDVTKGAKIPLGDKRRVTHTYHPRGGDTEYSQLDALLVSPDAQDLVLDVKVQPYYDSNGREMPVPDTFEQRAKQPSDHRAVVMKLDLQALLKRAGIIK